MSSIYIIKNSKNSKTYIGKTIKPLPKRLKEHFWAADSGSKLHLHRSIRKYGKESFTISLLEEADIKILSDREMFFIKLLKPALNMTRGGEGGNTTGGRISITNGLIHKFILKGTPIPEGFTLGVSPKFMESQKAGSLARAPRAKHSDASRAKMSEAHEKAKRRWMVITDGVVAKRVPAGSEIPVGFWRGLSDSNKINLRKKIVKNTKIP